MEYNKLDLPRSFCVAPWVHAHVGANGKRRLCCIADEAPENFAKLKYSEFKKSEYLKNIKKLMLSGVTPKECHNCENANRTEVYRDKLNTEFSDQISLILKSESDDNLPAIPLKYLDYRSNLCNLKCRTCDPSASTSFQNHINIQNKNIVRTLFPKYEGVDAKKVSQYFSQNYSSEMLELVINNEIDRIYFAGGEPVIEPNHIPFLEKLVEMNFSDKIALSYNTNLSFSEKYFNRWTSVLEKFKNVVIFISIDGNDKICDYIREGSVFETLKHNISKLSLNFKFDIYLDITLTSLNLFFIKEFAIFAIEQDIRVLSKLMFFGTQSFPLLRTETIPVMQKKMIIERWDEFYKNLPLKSQEILLNLDGSIRLFESKEQEVAYSKADYLMRLDLFESMYPEKNKFLDLLRQDPIGQQWVDILLQAEPE